jgi:phage terminase small subunit
MKARFLSWWQYIGKHWVATIIIVFVGVIVLIILGYLFRWDWTGFNNGTSQITITSPSNGNYKANVPQLSKSLWDWLQLLVIPVVLAVAGFWFNKIQKDRDQQVEEALKESEVEAARALKLREEKAAKDRERLERESREDNQRENALQTYIDKMSELLLHEKLCDSENGDDVRNIARMRTMTVLTQLDARRIGYVFSFLRETGLNSTTSKYNKVSLNDADLHNVNWSQANLRNADLSGANLEEADLSHTYLSHADLSDTNLVKANLSHANLNIALQLHFLIHP